MSPAVSLRPCRPAAQPVGMPRAEQIDLVSEAGRSFRVFLAWPEEAPADGQWDVFYVLDANAWFGTFVESLRIQSRRPATTKVRPAVAVGIGYPIDAPLDVARRQLDLTPSRPDSGSGQADAPTQGGADQLLDFIEGVVNPMVDSRFGLRAPRRALFGHSFGGLFALYALFTRTGCFQAYAAASPSIWYGDGAILDREAAFLGRRPASVGALAVQITAGSLEARAPAHMAASGFGDTADRSMATEAEAMARRLAASGPAGLTVAYHLFEGENHASVVPAAISRALPFFSTSLRAAAG